MLLCMNSLLSEEIPRKRKPPSLVDLIVVAGTLLLLKVVQGASNFSAAVHREPVFPEAHLL